MLKVQSLQNSHPATINPSKETLQDFLTRTALEFKALQMQLHPQHLTATNHDPANELLK